MLAKFFKDCGYTYPEIKKEMDRYRKKQDWSIRWNHF
jgi:hypothetical protein